MGALTKLILDSATDSIAIGAQAFVYAEDSAHVTADEGAFVLAVRSDTKASTAGTDGDYAALIQDADGDLYVTDTVSQGLLTTIDADTGGILIDTGTIATDTSVIAGDTTSIDGLLTALSKAEDSVHGSGDQGFMSLAVRNDTESSLVSADGDYAPLQVDSVGRLRVIGDLDVVGNVADDGVDSGNPLKVGMRGLDQGSVWGALSAANDRADMVSDLYRRQLINNAPNIGVKATQVSVDTTAGGTNLSPTPQAGRMKMDIRNTGSQDIFIGASGVTIGTGFQVSKGEALTVEIGEAIDLFAITASSTALVHVLELG